MDKEQVTVGAYYMCLPEEFQCDVIGRAIAKLENTLIVYIEKCMRQDQENSYLKQRMAVVRYSNCKSLHQQKSMV